MHSAAWFGPCPTLSVVSDPAAQAAGTTPRTVVIAEDEVLIRMDLAEMLAEEGYDVVGQAGDGARAIELAEELRPDLVMIGMSERSSPGAFDAIAEQLVKQQGVRDIIVVILPTDRSMIHLDMIFTMIDRDHCVVFAPREQ